MKTINAYVVGSSTSYANWLIRGIACPEGKIVSDIRQADIVVFTGGGDVHPSFYNRKVNPRTWATEPKQSMTLTRDEKEWAMMHEAVELKKPMWGTCRGLQLMCAYAGGDLIQDVNHGGGSHEITFYDGTVVTTNTIHHQMIYPFEKLVKAEDYFIVANSLGLSPYHRGETDENLPMPVNENGIILEPESAFFPKINGFGQQSHLEMRGNDPVVLLTRKLVEHQIEGTLATVLENNIPFVKLLDKNFNIERYIKNENTVEQTLKSI